MKRSAALARRTGLSRSPVRRAVGAPALDWTQARAKVCAEARCRVCRRTDADLAGVEHLEAAHTIGRAHDASEGRVRAVDTVPLCTMCHRGYDSRLVSIVGYLSPAEEAAAVEHVRLERALRRLSSGKLEVRPVMAAVDPTKRPE